MFTVTECGSTSPVRRNELLNHYTGSVEVEPQFLRQPWCLPPRRPISFDNLRLDGLMPALFCRLRRPGWMLSPRCANRCRWVRQDQGKAALAASAKGLTTLGKTLGRVVLSDPLSSAVCWRVVGPSRERSKVAGTVCCIAALQHDGAVVCGRSGERVGMHSGARRASCFDPRQASQHPVFHCGTARASQFAPPRGTIAPRP